MWHTSDGRYLFTVELPNRSLYRLLWAPVLLPGDQAHLLVCPGTSAPAEGAGYTRPHPDLPLWINDAVVETVSALGGTPLPERESVAEADNGPQRHTLLWFDVRIPVDAQRLLPLRAELRPGGCLPVRPMGSRLPPAQGRPRPGRGGDPTPRRSGYGRRPNRLPLPFRAPLRSLPHPLPAWSTALRPWLDLPGTSHAHPGPGWGSGRGRVSGGSTG